MRFAVILFSLLGLSLAAQADSTTDTLTKRITEIHQQALTLSYESCETTLNPLFGELSKLQPSAFNRHDLEAEGWNIIESLWQIRTDLRKKLTSFYRDGRQSSGCTTSVRNALRAIRGVEDYIGHIAVTGGKEKADHLGLVSEYPADTLINHDFNHAELRSGDILISHGGAVISSLIARLGDTDTQFSHMAFLYIDPLTKKKYTIESHIEIGSIVTPFEKYLGDGKIRSAIYRFSDPKTAHEAATIMYHRVRKAMLAHKNVPYDFKMDATDHKNLFCSEVVRAGFEEATKGATIVPMYPSTFTMKNRSLLKRLGTNAVESFIPADIEGDARFELVGEWRNFREVSREWRYDAIFTKIFQWMEEDGAEFFDPLKYNIKKFIAYVVRHTPILGKTLEEKFPKNMTMKLLGTMFVVTDVVSEFDLYLKKANEEALKSTGYPLTIEQNYKLLDDYHATHPKLHKYFHSR